MAAVVHAWWCWVLQLADTVSQSTDEQLGSHLPLACGLLATTNWQNQTLTLKQASLCLNTCAIGYRHDPVTLSLSPESLQHWWSWAEWMVSSFSVLLPRSRVVMATCLVHHSARDCHSADFRYWQWFIILTSNALMALLLHNAYLADSSQICLTIWLNTWVIYHNPERS